MSYKRKGQLSSYSEWAKHLRKIGKRFFWRKERIEGKKEINKELDEMKKKPD
jgi:hypothetical protein